MIKSFPKIFQMGTKYISNIFDGEVEITEKVDGSQFVFGKLDGQLYMRSKGTQQYRENPDKMFQRAVDYVGKIEDLIPDNTIFYCEYLNKEKHNVLVYNRVPINNLILFGVATKEEEFSSDLVSWASKLGIESVPVVFKGIASADMLLKLLENESILGGVNIEGVVVKNYNKTVLVGGQVIPIMTGKYVSEKFKEVHNKDWKKENTGHGKWDTFKMGFRTEARWNKAIQFLKENNTLVGEPRDIGLLVKRVREDICEEEKENIKDMLWKIYSGEILRYASAGLPEWYKEQLLKSMEEK